MMLILHFQKTSQYRYALYYPSDSDVRKFISVSTYH